MSKKLFITGSEGFVGSHLVELLVKKNYNVKALVQYNSFNNLGWLKKVNKKIVNEIDVVFGDVRDKEFLENNTKDCDKIIHLAALIGIPYSYYAPRSYIDVNVTGTLNLLEIAKKKNFKKFIHTSTSEIYGSAKYIPMDEDHPINPQSPYAASKSSSDQLAMSYFYSYDMPITILRPFNIFGPRQSNRAVIPTIINQVINSKKNIMLGSKNTTRDFTYVEDTVSAYEKTLNSRTSNGEILNVGNNFEVSINDIVEIVSKIFKKKINIKLDKKRLRPKKSEVNRLYANNNKVKKIIGWKPVYSKRKGFEKALKITCEWFNNQSNNLEFESKNYQI
tara:strand:+ start:48 stop:1049 length:1002 start_codon:yes stop_codon:yes gene_type:complete